ncbi:MAG: type III ribulose-bisphosphate carboxylase [Candidatus Diapherotrites archaeon]
MPAYSGFIELNYKPNKNDLIAGFFLEPNNCAFAEAAQAIASESSIGTWTDIATLKKETRERLKARIFYLNEKEGTAKIAYPLELFELGNIPQLLSSVAGNVFGMSIVNNLRLQDIEFPEAYIKAFKGPEFGVQGIRKLMRIEKRPLIGTIIKPKLGLNEKEHAKVAYNAWLGGIDIVKDDENLTSMPFNNFQKRVQETLKMRDKVQEETGEKKIYMPNITAECNEMLKRGKFIKEAGGEYAMVDLITLGFSSLQSLRDAELKLVLHGHRAMHAAFTRNPKHGISMLVIAKLCRLIGLDQLHVGAIVGKMTGEKEEVKLIGEEIEQQIITEKEESHLLAENWFNIKPVFAVCSGGLHPGKIPALIQAMGRDIVIQAGGGIHGHPKGTIAGAKAMRQSVEATIAGIQLHEYAKTHKELREALEKWKD